MRKCTELRRSVPERDPYHDIHCSRKPPSNSACYRIMAEEVTTNEVMLSLLELFTALTDGGGPSFGYLMNGNAPRINLDVKWLYCRLQPFSLDHFYCYCFGKGANSTVSATSCTSVRFVERILGVRAIFNHQCCIYIY